MSQPVKEPADFHHVEVDVESEVGADVGVGAHQGAVESRPHDADHHGDGAQQQQDQAGVPTRLVCREYRQHTKYSSGCYLDVYY